MGSLVSAGTETTTVNLFTSHCHYSGNWKNIHDIYAFFYLLFYACFGVIHCSVKLIVLSVETQQPLLLIRLCYANLIIVGWMSLLLSQPFKDLCLHT